MKNLNQKSVTNEYAKGKRGLKREKWKEIDSVHRLANHILFTDENKVYLGRFYIWYLNV